MIYAGSGHRPHKLGGYGIRTEMKVVTLASKFLLHARPERIIVGMAQGWDMGLAQAAINYGIPFDAYIPFLGQDQVWPQATRLYYAELLKKARLVKVCSEGSYSSKAMTHRNKCMVDDCDKLATLWDGSAGGTSNAVAYAELIGKPYINLWSQYDLAR